MMNVCLQTRTPPVSQGNSSSGTLQGALCTIDSRPNCTGRVLTFERDQKVNPRHPLTYRPSANKNHKKKSSDIEDGNDTLIIEV